MGDRQRNSPVRGSRSWVERTSGSWKGPVEREEETRGLGPKGGIGDGPCQSRCPPHRLKPAAWGELTGQGALGGGETPGSPSLLRDPKAWLVAEPGWESGCPTRREPVSTNLGRNRVEGTGGKCEHREPTARNGQRIEMRLKPRKIRSRKCPQAWPVLSHTGPK